MVDEGEETSPQVVTLCQAGSSPVVHPNSLSRALTNGRQPVPKTGVVVMSPRGSIPPLSSDCSVHGAVR